MLSSNTLILVKGVKSLQYMKRFSYLTLLFQFTFDLQTMYNSALIFKFNLVFLVLQISSFLLSARVLIQKNTQLLNLPDHYSLVATRSRALRTLQREQRSAGIELNHRSYLFRSAPVRESPERDSHSDDTQLQSDTP